MLALRITEFGSPDRLRLEETPLPTLQANEALVEVHAAGINPSDLGNVLGRFPQTRLPRTPGRDFAGVVAAGGTAEVGTGSAVWGSGAEFGFTQEGSHAQYIVVPQAALASKPAALSMLQAGAVGVPFVTAWLTLQAAELSEGDALIVTGARGAVGSAAAQIARRRGVRVVGVDRRDDPSDKAFPIVGSGREDLADALKELTGGAHACIDTVGGPLFSVGLGSLREGGRMVVITAQGDGRVTFDLRNFYHRGLHLVGVDSLKVSGAASARILDDLRDGFESGQLTAPEPTPIPLPDAILAYQRMYESTQSSASVPKMAIAAK